ncbi:DUF3332 domain-containing protein [Algivirga pacifica]|uniref:DUF3332 domain-containing protein n=1 Tax=Algivirga pacifica TaxID=1162670 RepID=A0ABP9DC96_9BACT
MQYFRRLKLILMAVLVIGVTTIQTSCYGPFRLTTKLHDWNGQIGDKFINALVFLLLVIVPVYSITLLADGIIFNTIEFFGGKNPISMNEGEIDIQRVQKDGKLYEVVKKRNMIQIKQLEGPEAGQEVAFHFKPEESSWYLDYQGEYKKILKVGPNGEDLTFFRPDGKAQSFTLGMEGVLTFAE